MSRSDTRGFALLGVLMLSALLAALLAGYFSLTRIDMSTVDASLAPNVFRYCRSPR